MSNKERQVILSADEIHSVLSSDLAKIKKTELRIPTWDHYGTDIMDWALSGVYKYEGEYRDNNTWVVEIQSAVDDSGFFFIKCPFGAAGDILYVREAFAIEECGEVKYKADNESLVSSWKSPVAMPRSLSRIFLRVESINIERVSRGVWGWAVEVSKITKEQS